MKRLSKFNPFDIEVEIIYSTVSRSNQIAASKNKNSIYKGAKLLPSSPINLNEDTQMYADFETFLSKSLRIFKRMGFYVNESDSRFSDKSNTTYYITATHPMLDEEIRCVFCLRISTHDMKYDDESLINRNEYYSKHTQKLYPNLSDDDWKFEEVRVNNVACKSYSQAEQRVEDKLNDWIDDMIKAV